MLLRKMITIFSLSIICSGLGFTQSIMEKNMVLVKGSSFTMGSPETEDWREQDEIQHEVTLSDFYISKYEITQAEYKSVMGINPSTSSIGDNFPVETVTWYNAIEFCNRLSVKEHLTPVYTINGTDVLWNKNANGYRLPTEAEWEYACRAGTKTPFNTEDSPSSSQANYYGYYPYMIEDNYFSTQNLETQPGTYRQRTVTVDSFKPNKLGLYNMHGNVSEWCWDFYDEYSITPQTNPTGPTNGYLRICRGGGWNDFAKHMRTAFRSAQTPDDAFISRGFRVVRNKT